jgi:hypothetical protein
MAFGIATSPATSHHRDRAPPASTARIPRPRILFEALDLVRQAAALGLDARDLVVQRGKPVAGIRGLNGPL